MKIFQLMKFHTKLQRDHCALDSVNFIRVWGSEFKHLVLFDNGMFDKICEYLITEK